MNYRHAFHAGNFADVVKHATLARVLAHLCEKPAAFRVIDTHAGEGRYDLDGAPAQRTGEWRDGIGRLRPRQGEPVALPAKAAALLAPYLDAVAQLNADDTPRFYPGSPALAQALMRPQDRLVACEFSPTAAQALSQNLGGDRRAKAVEIDGWTALGAYVPPPERRGLVLIDPPFETPDEFARMAQGLATAHRKWSTGIYLLWYPVKEAADVTGFVRALRRLRIPKMLRLEVTLAAADAQGRLRGTGLVVVNPPWRLHEELAILMPALAKVLARQERPRITLEWIAGEAPR